MGARKNLVGRQVRQWRDRRDVTQSELAVIFQRHGWDISRDTIQNIEEGSRTISDFELVILSAVLRESLETLTNASKALTESYALAGAAIASHRQGWDERRKAAKTVTAKAKKTRSKSAKQKRG